MKRFSVLMGLLVFLCAPCRASFLTYDPSKATETFATTYTVDLHLAHPTIDTTQVDFLIHNTTDPSVGGTLTGVALDLPGSLLSVLLMPDHFSQFSSPVNTSPFPDLPYGFGLGKSWLGGGSPADGIAAGQSAVLSLLISGHQTESVFRALYAPGTTNFIARFRGLENGGSNKVPASVVPEPASIISLGLGLGLLGMGFYRRR